MRGFPLAEKGVRVELDWRYLVAVSEEFFVLAKNSWYGTQSAKERFVAWLTGHVDSADAVAARPPWIRHRPVHSTIIRQ